MSDTRISIAVLFSGLAALAGYVSYLFYVEGRDIASSIYIAGASTAFLWVVLWVTWPTVTHSLATTTGYKWAVRLYAKSLRHRERQRARDEDKQGRKAVRRERAKQAGYAVKASELDALLED